VCGTNVYVYVLRWFYAGVVVGGREGVRVSLSTVSVSVSMMLVNS